MTLVQYDSEGSENQIARDLHPNWITAVEIIDEDVFLGTDDAFSLFIYTKDGSTMAAEERCQMSGSARIYIGDTINTIRHGTLVRQHLGETTAQVSGSLLFGTASGVIGLVKQIPPSFYEFLLKLQKRLTNLIKPVGKIDHSFLRSFYNTWEEEPCEGFIDGDLIESYLDLSMDMKTVVTGLQERHNNE